MYPNDIATAGSLSFRTLRLAVVSFLFSFLIFFSSCEEPSFVGLEIQPGEDRFRVREAEVTSVSSLLWQRDSLLAIVHPRSLLGIVNDPLFGRAKASFITQVGIEGSIDFGSDPVPESLVLQLYYDNVYGDHQTPQTIRVYEVSEVVDAQYLYHSNLDPREMIYDQLLGSRVVSNQEGDSLISITLNNVDLQNKLLYAPDSVLRTVSTFISYFKGLYVTVESTEGTGAMYSTNLNSVHSRLTLNYRNTDHPDSTLQFHYIINQAANRINLFEHDYSDAVFYGNLEQTVTMDSVYYVQGTAGVMSRLDFEDLHHWRDSMPVSIHSARLFLPVENDDTAGDFPVPSRLALFERDDAGRLHSVVDVALGDNYFRGTFDTDTGEYVFNINQWVQDYIMNGEKNNSLYVSVRFGATVPNRAVLRGKDHPLGGPRLKITYTRH